MSLLSAVLQEADKASTEDYTKLRNAVYPKLKDFAEKVQMLSWSLQVNLIDNYVTFTTPTKSLEQINYKSRKENLVSEFDKVAVEVKDIKSKFDNFDEDFIRLWKSLHKSFDLLKNLCIAVEAKRDLEMANHLFTRYKYYESMTLLSQLQDRLKFLKFEDKIAIALSNIISQAENQYSIYSSNLSVEWEDIISWSEKKSYNYLTYSLSIELSDPVHIKTVLNTLYVTNRLNLELGRFSKFFVENLLHDIIRHNCDIYTEDDIAPNHTIVFNIKINLLDDSKPSFQTVFNNLMAVFDFLQLTLGTQLNDPKAFMGTFAKSIKGKFFHKIIEDCIRNNLPSCKGSYENYKNLVVELETFNKFLIDLNFISIDESPLNKFLDDTESVLYNKKCDKLLSDMRNLMNQSLAFGIVTVGETSCKENESVLDVTDKDAWDLTKPLLLPKCVISQNVKTILSKILEHLEESTKLPENYSKQLILYIRYVAIMYQCIVPFKFEVNLKHCPLDIALFFNNCFYLAHGLLGPPWKAILPSHIAENLTIIMIECIQDLRVLGLSTMSLYLENQKNIIMKTIQPDELKSWTNETFDQFDGAINNALNLMKNLKENWQNILPTKMYEMSLCMLIQALCQAILLRVFADSQPTDEYLIYKIAMRLGDMQQDFKELFEEPKEMEKRIDVWQKFVKLPQLMKAQLLEIARLWEKDEELSKVYTCEEVRQIIKMRFPDDKYRLKMLVLIQ